MSLTGSFSILRLPGLPAGPKEFLEIVVDQVQLVTCTDIVTLEATIVTNYPGHTYLWTQIAGPAVVWLEPQNQLMVTFQKPVTSEDLVFRFWADRYTSKQQYKDIIVTGIARDDVPYGVVTTSYGGLTDLLSGATNSQIVPGISAYGTVTVDNTQKMLFWTNPSDGQFYSYTKTEVYANNGGVLTLLATIPYPGRQYFDTDTNQPTTTNLYTLRTYYYVYGVNSLGVPLGRVEEYVDTLAPAGANYSGIRTIDGSDVVNSFSTILTTTGNLDYFQTQILSLQNLPETTDDTLQAFQFTTQSTGIIDYFQTQILTLQNLPELPEDTLNSFALNTSGSGNITIFQVQISSGITVIG